MKVQSKTVMASTQCLKHTVYLDEAGLGLDFENFLNLQPLNQPSFTDPRKQWTSNSLKHKAAILRTASWIVSIPRPNCEQTDWIDEDHFDLERVIVPAEAGVE